MTDGADTVLVVGVGNPVMGDDGVGPCVVASLAAFPGLPRNVELIDGGTDLLRCADRMRGKQTIIVVDARLDAEHPGRVSVREDIDAPSRAGANAHRVPVTQSVELLRAVDPGLTSARFVFVTIGVSSVTLGEGLSLGTASAVPRAVERVLECIG